MSTARRRNPVIENEGRTYSPREMREIFLKGIELRDTYASCPENVTDSEYRNWIRDLESALNNYCRHVPADVREVMDEEFKGRASESIVRGFHQQMNAEYAERENQHRFFSILLERSQNGNFI